MRSIEKAIISEYQIQKSKFITYLFPIYEFDEIEQHLEQVKQLHPNATHHCYAYQFHNQKRCSDDGEPSGTAGMPILNVLEKQNLNCILSIVVRYFGGILLGAGGLVRAYTTSVVQSLNEATYVTIEPGKKVTLHFSYDQKQMVDSILKQAHILTQEYLDTIHYQISVSNITWEQIQNQLLPYLLKQPILEDAYFIQKETI